MDVTIPRSPFFYIIAAPFTYLPGQGAHLALMALCSTFDALVVLLIALFVVQLGGSGRAAVLAALLAGVIPLGLLLAVSWGIFPTLVAQCLALLTAVLWLMLRPWLAQRRVWLGWMAVLALAYLAYPTALLFFGLSWLVLVALLALRRDAATMPTLVAGIGAALIAFVLFYGWHAPSLLERTLPALFGNVTEGSVSNEGLSLNDVLKPMWRPLEAQYGRPLLALALGGVLLALVRWPRRQRVYGWLMLLAWCAPYPLLALIDQYVATLILKQVLYLLPPLAILAGLLLGRLAQRPAGGVVAGVLVGWVLWHGLLLELHQMIYAYAQLK